MSSCPDDDTRTGVVDLTEDIRRVLRIRLQNSMSAACRAYKMAHRSAVIFIAARWVLVALLCSVACSAARTTPQLGNASNGETPEENLLNRVARTLEQAGPFPAGARVVEVNSEEVRGLSPRAGHVEWTRPVFTPGVLIGFDVSAHLTPTPQMHAQRVGTRSGL